MSRPATEEESWSDQAGQIAIVVLIVVVTVGGSPEARFTGLIDEVQEAPVQLVNVGIGANLISPRSPNYQYSSKPSAMERLEQHVLAGVGCPLGGPVDDAGPIGSLGPIVPDRYVPVETVAKAAPEPSSALVLLGGLGGLLMIRTMQPLVVVTVE
jgi:hypothetical protein